MDSNNECDGKKEKSPVHKQSKLQVENTVIELNEENKKLRKDNERLRRLQSFNEGIFFKYFCNIDKSNKTFCYI